MSYKNQVRTKQIRQKISSGSYQAFPIGADANLIDMFSTLDLEQELKLGGDHYVEIDEQEDYIQIKEWYFSELRRDRTLEEMKSFITYCVLTKIQNFTTDETTVDGDKIIITLYKGDFEQDQVLHQKEIMIRDETPTFITIDQGVDKEDSGI